MKQAPNLHGDIVVLLTHGRTGVIFTRWWLGENFGTEEKYLVKKGQKRKQPQFS